MLFSNILFITLAFIFNSVKSEDELVAVTVLYRHGDRTPVQFYPNDPYKNLSHWSSPPGELTNTGKQQHFALGKWLRKRYDGFLSPYYRGNEIYIRSSDVNRCIMSAQVNLAGLYPPKGQDVWSDELLWQPIPIHTIPAPQDDIAVIFVSCKNYIGMMLKATELPYWQQIDEENKEFYEYLSLKSGMKIRNIVDVTTLYDILHVETVHNMTLPDWALEALPQMEKLDDIAPPLYVYTPEMARVFMGRLFNSISLQFSAYSGKIKFEAGYFARNEKFRVFSAHDYQVGGLLNVLKVKNLKRAPYAASIMLELRKSKDGKYYVQILYKTKETEADIVQMENCDLECDIDEFLEIIKPVAITKEQFDAECNEK